MFIDEFQKILPYSGYYVLTIRWIEPGDLPSTFPRRNRLYALPAFNVLNVLRVSTFSERVVI